MTRCVVEKTAFFHFEHRAVAKTFNFRGGQFYAFEVWVILVRIPAVIEGDGIIELIEIGVVTELWHPINGVAHVLIAYSPFNTDASVAV